MLCQAPFRFPLFDPICTIRAEVRLDIFFILRVPDALGNVTGIGSAPVNYFESIINGTPETCTLFSHLFGGVGPLFGPGFEISANVDDIAFDETGTVTSDGASQDSHPLRVTFSGSRVGDSIVGTGTVEITGLGSFDFPITLDQFFP